MIRFATLIVLSLALAALPMERALAQDLNAELRTWAGQSLQLGQVSIEVFYTIVPPPKDDDQGGATGSMEGISTLDRDVRTGAGRMEALQLFGSMRSLGAMLDRGPDPMQGNKSSDSVTLYRGGVAQQVPVTSIATMMFDRTPVRGSGLPPYVAPSHYRFAATAILTDGRRVEGDYVNLGTAIIRGTTREGKVEVPWQDIESIRFIR